jgi:hypothetical protein
MEKEDVLKMFDAVDIDQSGFIDYSEFVVAAMSEKQLLTDEKLLSAFKMFDKVSTYLRLRNGVPFYYIIRNNLISSNRTGVGTLALQRSRRS